ncbi:MAG: UTP--glucose-1-phosphate uridylyltransferase GalU [Thermoplasmatota archaeon]
MNAHLPHGLRAVIPAAGFGTRMLPATKSMPKEMLPVLDRPAIQYVVEEASHSGLEDILIITGRGKRAVEDHFDEAPELEQALEEKGKTELLERLRAITNLGRVFTVRQHRALGLGHAVLQAWPHTRDDPFAVLLGDDIIVGDRPATRQLLDVHEETGSSVFCVQQVAPEEVSKYGVVEVERVEKGLYRVVDMVEKPPADEAPSDLATIGRYVFTPTIMPLLAKTKPGHGGEIQLTDAIRDLLAREEVYALAFEGTRYDVGSFEGWLEATVALAAQEPRYRDVIERTLS